MQLHSIIILEQKLVIFVSTYPLHSICMPRPFWLCPRIVLRKISSQTHLNDPLRPIDIQAQCWIDLGAVVVLYILASHHLQKNNTIEYESNTSSDTAPSCVDKLFHSTSGFSIVFKNF